MRRSSVAAVAVATALCGTAGEARAQTVGDVVGRYLEARGGLAKLRSVETLRLTGTLELPDVSAPFVLELKRPKKMRTEFTVEGRIGVRAYDGTTAWAQPPLPGEPAREMGPEDAAEARSQADVDLSPLVDAAAKGYTVELVGRDRLPGGEVFELLVKGRDGSIIRMYLDTKTHLVVRTEERRSLEGKPVDFVTDVGDYRSVGGLVFPFRIEVGPKGDPERSQRLDIQKIEVNPALDDARFRMPARQPPATP